MLLNTQYNLRYYPLFHPTKLGVGKLSTETTLQKPHSTTTHLRCHIYNTVPHPIHVILRNYPQLSPRYTSMRIHGMPPIHAYQLFLTLPMTIICIAHTTPSNSPHAHTSTPPDWA